MNKLIFGCGYLGQRVAKRWLDDGAEVYVVTRSPKRAAELRDNGYQPIVADVTRRESLIELPVTDTVLFAVGHDRAGQDRTEEPDIEAVYAGGMRNVLESLPAKHGPFVYISTTGVYGDAAGGWVDESTTPDPQRAGGIASLAAERSLIADRGDNAIVLRLGGIYGPGRIPHLDRLRAGQAIAAPSEGWLNLIHVDDAAQTVIAADLWATRQPAGSGPHVFCVCDGNPVVRGDFYREIASQIGVPPPEFAPPDPGSPAAARAGVTRRVSNRKMIHTLDVEPTYWSYVDGLAAILSP